MHFVMNVKRFYSFQDKQDGEDDKKIDIDVGDKLSENLADSAGVGLWCSDCGTLIEVGCTEG